MQPVGDKYRAHQLILNDAAHLLRKSRYWSRGRRWAFSLRKRYCIQEALFVAAHQQHPAAITAYREIVNYLEATLGRPLEAFNNDWRTRHRDILAALDDAWIYFFAQGFDTTVSATSHPPAG